MLLEFTVENFRSIKEPVTLSAIAQSRGSKQSANNSRSRIKSDEEIALPYEVPERGLKVLPVLAIFGANASGKTNVIQALDYLLSLMCFGNGLVGVLGRNILTPFRLSGYTIEDPTRFEISMLFDGSIYTYSIVLTSQRIIEERLNYSLLKTKRNRLLFHRHWDSLTSEYKWRNGEDFAGAHIQLQPNIQQGQTFINLIVTQLNLEITRSLSHWLKARIVGITLEDKTIHDALIFMHQFFDESGKNPKFSGMVFDMVKKFDTGIDKIEITKSHDEEKYSMYALHRIAEGKTVKWLFEEESLGTQRLIVLAMRVLTSIVRPIGGLTIVDEISANIHPNISREIIKMFQNPKSNPNHAQLIFTSHDNTLKQRNLLRRDQIWFTEKRPDHSTVLYPLTDFKVRNDLAIDKAYLDGRFGAVPILPTDDGLTLTNGSK